MTNPRQLKQMMDLIRKRDVAEGVAAIVIVVAATIAGATVTTVAMIGLAEDVADHAFLAARAAMIQVTFLNIQSAAAAAQ